MKLIKPNRKSMKILKPDIIEISPGTIEAIRPRKLFFSMHNEQTVTFSKGLTTELGRTKNVSFGYSDQGIFLWPDLKGFPIVRYETSFRIQSKPLVDTLIGTVKMQMKMRYYVTLELDGPGIPRYKVMFSSSCSVHNPEPSTEKKEEAEPSSYSWEPLGQSVDVRGEQAKPSSQPV